MLYYFKTSNRRKILDRLQEKYKSYYRGTVLDIGGRDRGRFKKPKNQVTKWIFADVEGSHNPDLVADVADMKEVGSDTIDVVNAMELFEHVDNIEKGISECIRVLKPGGTFIISMPFLSPIHGDPYDFQRWTETRWLSILEKHRLMVEVFEITGRFFTVETELKKAYLRSLPRPIKILSYILFPLLDAISNLDNTDHVLKNPIRSRYHGGYFIISNKPNSSRT